jgi:hypothetical protein
MNNCIYKDIDVLREKSEVQLEAMRNGHTLREDLNDRRHRYAYVFIYKYIYTNRKSQ